MKRRTEKAPKTYFYNILCLFKVHVYLRASFFKPVVVGVSISQNRVLSKKLFILCDFNNTNRNHSLEPIFELPPFVFLKNKLKRIGNLYRYLVMVHVYTYLLKCLLNWNGIFFFLISVSILWPLMKIYIFL